MSDQQFEMLSQRGGIETPSPVKMWTRGVPVEQSAMEQLANLAHMPFIHRHVAAMPDVHWGLGATVGSVIATKGAIIPAAVGVDIGCFIGETKIPLLDGSQATLKSLTELQEPFWVYSLDADKKIVPGKARAVCTRNDASLIRIIVSGGDEIICTPDHQFMMNDGSYRAAQDLKFNDSLMPLYRRWATRDGYESVSIGKGSSKMTHILVWEATNGTVPKGHVVHHENHVHFDNKPENLTLMTISAHSSHHRKFGKKFNNADPLFQEKRLAGIAKRMNDPFALGQMIKVGTTNIKNYMAERPEHFKETVSKNGKRGAPYLKSFNVTPRACGDCGFIASNPASLRWHKKREHSYNHKVVSITTLDERADVYCLQVEEHHNFALSAGVFVHNCGMMGSRTNLTASDLPDNLHAIRTAIEAAVPHGRTDNGGSNDRGAWGDVMDIPDTLAINLKEIVAKHPKRLEKAAARAYHHIGTLGTGNHFIEICLDESNFVWFMLHSGSRGIGNAIGQHFIELAKEDMRKWFINLPDTNLAYLPEGTQHFDDYLEAVGWAQEYALANREMMMANVIKAVRSQMAKPFDATVMAVNCHHNYVTRERHWGANVLVTRKGAVSAQKGDLGIIPGSMGARSYIVRGKGNPESFCSCSHGAGRKMGRNEAKKTFTLADHEAATFGVECRKDIDVIDETPGAYKAIEDVMAAQSDLVEIVHTLKQVVVVKG